MRPPIIETVACVVAAVICAGVARVYNIPMLPTCIIATVSMTYGLILGILK